MILENKVAVITGGSQGFGKRMAERLVERGAKVVLGDISPKGADVAASLNRDRKCAVFQICDVTKSDQLQSLIDLAIAEFGALDIMVNNAGVVGSNIWDDSSDKIINLTIDVNLRAVINGTRLAVRYWNRTGQSQAAVVNVSSAMAFFPSEFSPVYGATKAGVVNFTASCSTLAPRIRVNAVAPNYADTQFIDKLRTAKNASPLFDNGLISVDEVVDQMIRCVEDESLAGDVIRLMPNKEPKIHNGRKAVPMNIQISKL
ncbi:hypothetical protein H4219_003604 [Mycoemilia scoparia]|uniref:15-hydroxyprostaglandin dehydrogenase n=1 Tax=Mycoemilia scoparia TaxID=417184 RepID=A0A9W7ZU94_9FUNG|nr:hypothetical protein H4219_003604 [Mycoemilia scoparia]